MPRLSAGQLIAATVDPGSYESWDRPVDLTGFDAGYRDELAAAAAKAGTDESVLTGCALVGGHRAALVVSEFGFLGGSIGTAAAGRIVAAIERATRERLPLLGLPASGGTRMQEGTPAFVRMIDICRAVVEHKAAGLPYLVYLRHPTTGGVLASWASLGHVAIAEPDALIGFLGPVVYRTLHGHPFPAGVQVAENLAERGIVDAVVAPDAFGGVAARVLDLLARRTSTPTLPASALPAPAVVAEPDRDAWTSIRLTRDTERPGLRELLRDTADDCVLLGGGPAHRGESGLVLALVSLLGTACVLVGQDRHAQACGHLIGPAELRAARRGMRLAQELGLPLVCVVDTPGAELSVAAEEGALAGEIARCMADMVELTVPSVSVLLGAGAGGAALALLPARRVVAAGNAWLAPLTPEGASAIVHGDAGRAPHLARQQRVRAADLRTGGVVDAVVAEDLPAHLDPAGFVQRIAAECVRQLALQCPPVTSSRAGAAPAGHRRRD